ncbi:hypothetical protein [Microbacterium sp. 69-10]|uniref:hypothetical protein n=1 Tax=Microbacterium sp. 69-10 TaxID=1895783 RepID=UPI0025D01521|nr:hypothetical protein [Microbacterium sp. 69-10]
MKSTMGVPVKTSLAGFSAGNIISDAVFTDTTTMTEAQIQSFFNSKVTTCRGGTDEDGRPIVCIKDFRMNTVNRPADTYCKGYTGAAGESAARIIYRVSQSCGINPQVLIVMLQKEQSLVTHTWPSAWRYDKALGQGCPDGGVACDPKFVGFFHQVYGAARQMQIYMEGVYFKWYAPGKTWNILWNAPKQVSPGVWKDVCGSGPVYVANKATSALYYYTPYQPNAAALSAGYGYGDSCSSYGNRNFYNYFTDWFGSTQKSSGQGSPVGFVDGVTSSVGEIRVNGWALDPDAADSIGVTVTVDGVATTGIADGPRGDLAAHYPGLGINHGYSLSVAPQRWGDTEVCVEAKNVGSGADKVIGCATIFAYGGSPLGSLDGLAAGRGTVSVSGWALDPDVKDSIDVHVYVGGSGKAVRANLQRADIGNAYPLYGAGHGYGATVPAPAGYQTVCVYGINVKTGSNVLLSPCRQIFVKAATDPERAPFGSVDGFDVEGDIVTVHGWALDADTPDPIGVHVYVGASGTAHRADGVRRDIADVYPGYGENHGFTIKRTLPPGGAQVCVYAINDAAGGNTVLGCRYAAPALGSPPFGNVDSFDVQGNTVSIRGWALDPDTSKPIAVHVYVGGSGTAHTADGLRRDVAAAYPGSGDAHGFTINRTLPAGGVQVCVYAINDGTGGNTVLACRFVRPALPLTSMAAPYGAIDGMSSTNGRVSVNGWAIDPDTAEPIAVHIYVGDTGYAFTADERRVDVGTVYPAAGANHGYSASVPLSGRARTVCVYAINNGAGNHTLLGCRSF